MARSPQKRTLETRAALIAAAREIIAGSGYEAMRVEEVVARAGVAKGTFFAHFRDKDGLMDILIGAEIDALLDRIEAAPAPQSVEEVVAALDPLLRFLTAERYVFDLMIRYSGAAARDDIGPIAMTFERQIRVIARWLADGPFRRDVSGELLAEGVQAFSIQAVSLQFCALHSERALQDRLVEYLAAWLRAET
ncbi:MAG: TetR/AcrR family transcriptional regulator [Pseudomonadota bacterium]